MVECPFCKGKGCEECHGYGKVKRLIPIKSKEQNAKELRKAWKEHLKRMEQKKNVKR